jgi:hypothetical protein
VAVTVQAFNTPTGNLAPVQDGSAFNAPFVNTATFAHGIGETCTPLEYRQYVKGVFKVNGVVKQHSLCGDDFLSPTTFKQDGCGPGPTIKPCTAYGHRACPAHSKDMYVPNQSTGCGFYMEDEPGFTNISNGNRYELDLSFRGEIINTSTGSIVQTRTWTTKGQTVAGISPVEAMMVGLRASDTVSGVYAGTSPETGRPEVYVVVYRAIGEPPLDTNAISIVLGDPLDPLPVADSPEIHEITSHGQSVATIAFSVPAAMKLPVEARVRVPDGMLRFDVQSVRPAER